MAWSAEDRNYALAWQAEQDAQCGCGQPRDESMSPDSDGAYEVTAVRCHACAAQAAKAKVYQDNAAGLYFTVRRSPTA